MLFGGRRSAAGHPHATCCPCLLWQPELNWLATRPGRASAASTFIPRSRALPWHPRPDFAAHAAPVGFPSARSGTEVGGPSRAALQTGTQPLSQPAAADGGSGRRHTRPTLAAGQQQRQHVGAPARTGVSLPGGSGSGGRVWRLPAARRCGGGAAAAGGAGGQGSGEGQGQRGAELRRQLSTRAAGMCSMGTAACRAGWEQVGIASSGRGSTAWGSLYGSRAVARAATAVQAIRRLPLLLLHRGLYPHNTRFTLTSSWIQPPADKEVHHWPRGAGG